MSTPLADVDYTITNLDSGPDAPLGAYWDESIRRHLLAITPASPAHADVTPIRTWRFIEAGDGEYNLCTDAFERPLHLDILNQDHGAVRTVPNLTTPGHYSGQYWTLTPWGDGTWRMRNEFSGPDLHLGVYDYSKEAIMRDGDDAGAHWVMTRTVSSAATGGLG